MTLHLAGAAWVLPLAAAMLALSGLISLYRLLRGPSRPDRAVAIDALTLLAVAEETAKAGKSIGLGVGGGLGAVGAGVQVDLRFPLQRAVEPRDGAARAAPASRF